MTPLTPVPSSDLDGTYTTPGPRASWSQLRRDIVFLIVNLPIAVAAFVVVVTGFTVGVSLLIIWVGIPVLVLTLGIARGFAQLERSRIRTCEQRALPDVYYRSTDGNLGRRLLAVLGDPQYWRDLAHAVVSFPVRIFTWVVIVTWIATAIGGIAYITYGWALERIPDNQTLWELIGIDSSTFGVLMNVALGLVFLATLPYVARALAAMEAALGRAMLTNPSAAENAALRERAEQLQLSRAAAGTVADPGGAGRTSRTVPRNRTAHPGGPRPAGRPRRCGRALPCSGRPRGRTRRRRPSIRVGRERRVLRGRRVSDQHRQAQPSRVSHRLGRPDGRRLARADLRRRHRRRPPGQGAWPRRAGRPTGRHRRHARGPQPGRRRYVDLRTDPGSVR